MPYGPAARETCRLGKDRYISCMSIRSPFVRVLTAGLLLALGCRSAPPVYQFYLPPPPTPTAPGAALAPSRDPTMVPLLRALRDQGVTPAPGGVDEAAGQIATRWEPQGEPAPSADSRRWWRRFLISQSRTDEGLLIAVRGEARRCPPEVSDPAALPGTCGPPEPPTAAQQDDVLHLGALLQQSLAAQPGATPTMPAAGPGFLPPLPPAPSSTSTPSALRR